MLHTPEVSFFFDTVSLSNFALAGRLDLLVARYGPRAQVTQEVLDEVSDGIVAGYTALQQIEKAVADGEFGAAGPLSAKERDGYRALLQFLGAGEASCIACAQSRGGTVVTDDRAARTACAERHVVMTGSIGILKACSLDGTLVQQEADEVLQAMIDAGFYAPVSRISDLI